MKRSLLPLGLFLALVSTLAIGLMRPDAQALNSPLVGKPVPAFQLTDLNQPAKVVSPAQFKGKVWVLNVWASWCTSCRKEHPVLLDLARKGRVVLVGFNYQDQREPAQQWLKQHGDPFVQTVFDADGRVGMDLGIIGVPETFVVDRRGVIRHKFTGPVSESDVNKILLPLIQELERG